MRFVVHYHFVKHGKTRLCARLIQDWTANLVEYMQAGTWTEQLSGETRELVSGDALTTSVPANGVQVWVREGALDSDALEAALIKQMSAQ